MSWLYICLNVVGVAIWVTICTFKVTGIPKKCFGLVQVVPKAVENVLVIYRVFFLVATEIMIWVLMTFFCFFLKRRFRFIINDTRGALYTTNV